MAYDVKKVEIWRGEIADRTGALAHKLAPLVGPKLNLAFVFARRQPDKLGQGVVFLTPMSGGAKTAKALAAAGFAKAGDMASIRVEAPDKPGECQRMALGVASAGISLRGLSASVIGKKFVVFMAFDSGADADRAAKLLKAAGKR